MQLDDWQSRWQHGQIGFHQAEVNPFLARYADRVWGTGGLGRVYVPLCGKSLDMVFLAERADEVVGVEYVEQAVREFFAEQGMTPDIEIDTATRFHAGAFTLFSADLFDLRPSELGSFDGVFDRAALVALEPASRDRYARHLRALLPVGARILLVTVDYDQDEMAGPPFAVSADEVHRLFGDSFEIEHLETGDALDQGFRDRGLTSMSESAFVLTRRGR